MSIAEPEGSAPRSTVVPEGAAVPLKARLERHGFVDAVFLDARFGRLVQILEEMGTAVVAYSGGVDSAFLLRVASAVLGERAAGVIGVSESLDQNEHEEARRTAAAIGVNVEVVETREYDNPAYRQNDGNRCYHCKTELFSTLKKFAAARGIRHVLDGSNVDDVGDYRPGFRARNEQGVRSPLQEAGLDKAAIRRFSRALGLPTWDKPAAPCLSSRIPYGQEVTTDKLRQVEAAEASLRQLGLRVVRVRHHGDVARIEVPEEDLPRLLEPAVRRRAIEAVRLAGFAFVSVDLEGFRSGSLNAVLRQGALAGRDAPPPDLAVGPAGKVTEGGFVSRDEVGRIPRAPGSPA